MDLHELHHDGLELVHSIIRIRSTLIEHDSIFVFIIHAVKIHQKSRISRKAVEKTKSTIEFISYE